ncbi:guanine nucleotide exchange factor Vps9 [Cordyceps militaris CM01]|uniref:Guanine nucleotide exchange factor Vps9 n=1 Tax=Cordyceps militaris (strain CM01) TaxID=983644 RepID=G3JUD6_CORMM|nr:guanine nucleotide exchange factor Vps9 [Cordyceps militaris CM01]EGX87910.1 guanine nucleotide exchange factor Vps9 [Cordyceps militaris CM01]
MPTEPPCLGLVTAPPLLRRAPPTYLAQIEPPRAQPSIKSSKYTALNKDLHHSSSYTSSLLHHEPHPSPLRPPPTNRSNNTILSVLYQGMTAPEQPAGGPEPPSQSPSEAQAQQTEADVEPRAGDAAALIDPSTVQHGMEPSQTIQSAQNQTSSTDNTPSDTAHVVESAPETPTPTTPPAQTGSKMSQQLAAATTKKQNDDASASAQDRDTMSSSAITIRPAKSDADPARQFLSPEPSSYVDPTPATPMTSQPTSRSPSNAARSHRSDSISPIRSAESEDKRYASEEEPDGGSRSEIQSIMEQFSEYGGGPGADEVMSPRLEITSPMFAGASLQHQHPPRKSSLEPLSTNTGSQALDADALGAPTPSPTKEQQATDDHGPPVPPKDGSFGTPPRNRETRASASLASPTSPQLSIHRPPPPAPEPEPTLPFDFHRFLEQLRNKKADPVARYLKSFLTEFAKRQWMVHEQVKIISDFLAFIANKMMLCEVWRDVSDAEFDNAREGMEKLVMNRLYSQTFSPAIPPPKPVPGARPKKRGGELPLGPGRRGQHQEDVERDDIVAQKINIYGWIKPEHLDIPIVQDSGRKFLKLAQQELLKIKSYRAPRDKIICVLNCCKVIFDSFMPLLIYVVLQSNPEHLVSNVQYILRFRNQDRLGGEAGYYLSSLMGAVQFVENMDRTSLTISDDEFEKSVEAAVSAIAERNAALSPTIRQQATFSEKPAWGHTDGTGSTAPERASPSTTARPSYDGESEPGDGAAISGLLRTFQRPLTTIGRIFSDEPVSSSPSSSSTSGRPMHPPRSSQDSGSLRPSTEDIRPSARPQTTQQQPPTHALSAEEAAARQASAETAEAQRLQRAEHANVVETLAGMFPDLDKDVISDVVYEKQGRQVTPEVGLAVDACLALSS